MVSPALSFLKFTLAIWDFCVSIWSFSSGSVVKSLPEVQEPQEMRFQSLGQEDPLEKGMETHSNVLAWRIPWTEEPSRLQSIGSQSVRLDLSNFPKRHAHIWFYTNFRVICSTFMKNATVISILIRIVLNM